MMRRSMAALVVMLSCAAFCRGADVPADTHVPTDASTDPVLGELATRLEEQAAEIQALRQQLDRHMAPFGPVAESSGGECGPLMRRLPVAAEDCWQPGPCETGEGPRFHTLRYFADYDRGFVIKPFCPQKYPFELNVNLWTQFRYHGFARDVESWTDNAGVTRPVDNRNAFDIERARFVFSGHALDERLTYFLQLDGDTDGAHLVDFFDYWWSWAFSDRFEVQMGKRKVTASRQWLLGARHTRFIDRPMACDFFRPDRTVGIFGVGRIGETGHYEIMVGNGYADANVPNSETDNRFTFAATNYFDVFGDFGNPLVDYDQTSEPLVQIGHSFVFSPNAANTLGSPREESNFVRLSDGTRLTQLGALAAGVTVSDFDVYFYGIDTAMKWQGWSMNAEVFFRWIEQLQGNGGLAVDDLFQRGFYVEGGRFIVPQTLDVNLRYSQVSGQFGNGAEYAVGLNWYPLDSSRMKVSLDVTQLQSSPLNNTTTDILVGDDGILVRAQFQAEF
jgi:hypothetical protein